MGLDLKTLAASKKYTSEALQGEGVTKGKDGFSPIITPNPDNNDQTYKLDITTANNSFTTSNLKGENGIINADSEEIFKSEDNLNPEEWTEIELLESGNAHGYIMTKISSMFKNIRYIWKILGTTDISKIGDGTVTGGINSLNSKLPVKISGNYTTGAGSGTGLVSVANTYGTNIFVTAYADNDEYLISRVKISEGSIVFVVIRRTNGEFPENLSLSITYLVQFV